MALPGKAYRQGVTLIELLEMFPDEGTATRRFEEVVWNGHRCCGHCRSVKTSRVPNAKPMPYWCSDCRSYFGVRTGTAIARSNVPLRKWAIAIYLCLTSLKSVFEHEAPPRPRREAEDRLVHAAPYPRGVGTRDERRLLRSGRSRREFVGGKSKNMHKWQREKLTGRGGVDKFAVVGVRDRATKRVRAAAIGKAQAPFRRGFVVKHTAEGATVYTDGEPAYQGMANQDSVRHSVVLVDADGPTWARLTS